MYSQFNQEETILDFFQHIESGIYVDIGCGPAQTHSNTYALYCKGWCGLCIDPQIHYKFDYWTLRPRDIYLQIGISNVTGQKTLYSRSLVATFETGVPNRNYNVENTVNVDTLANVLQQYPNIESKCLLCDIDVEHHEQQVLESIDFSRFRPQMFVIETFKRPWEHILFDNGYKLYASCLGIDRFYVLK